MGYYSDPTHGGVVGNSWGTTSMFPRSQYTKPVGGPRVDVNGMPIGGGVASPADPYAEIDRAQRESQDWNKSLFRNASNNATQFQNAARGSYDRFSGAADSLMSQDRDLFGVAKGMYDNSGISLNKWGAGDMTADSALYAPQAGAARAMSVRSGLGGTSSGQNQFVIKNSEALANLKNQQFQNLMAANQDTTSRFSAAGNLANSSLGVYGDSSREYNRVQEAGASTGPGESTINQMLRYAEMKGQGNTANMGGGGGGAVMAPGAYGGMATANYGIPAGFGSMPTQNYYAPKPYISQVQRQKMAAANKAPTAWF